MFALDARQVTKHEGLTTDYKSAALNQLSYAGVSPYESRF